jgi:hypothetical protein
LSNSSLRVPADSFFPSSKASPSSAPVELRERVPVRARRDCVVLPAVVEYDVEHPEGIGGVGLRELLLRLPLDDDARTA